MKSVFDVMKKMGQAQNAFHKLASQMMKDDRSDGIRFAKYLEKHQRTYHEILDDLPLYSDITGEEHEKLLELVR